jgi:DNA-binding MarR family transcriptional regulator
VVDPFLLLALAHACARRLQQSDPVKESLDDGEGPRRTRGDAGIVPAVPAVSDGPTKLPATAWCRWRRGTDGGGPLERVVDLRSASGHLLRRAQQVHTETWRRSVARVTGPQYAVLVAVAGWPGVDQTRAGELASLDKSTASGIVSRLVGGGWIERVQDRDDRRRRLLQLTTRGRADLAPVTTAAAAVQERLLASVPPGERDVFIDALARVARVDEGGLSQQPARGAVLVMARTPGYLIRRAQQWHSGCWAELVPDVTEPQYAVLATTVSLGVATQAQIASGASLDSSSAGDVVARLVERGWLTHVDDAQDRRRRPVRATAPATTALRLLRTPVVEVQEQVLAPLEPGQRAHFIRWMSLVAGLETADVS